MSKLISSTCFHINKTEDVRLYRSASYSMPAEYISRERCLDCGETSADDDTLFTDFVGFIDSLEDIVIDGIDDKDCPDFSDAYLVSATKPNGQELSENEIEFLSELSEMQERINRIANLQFNGG
jgi:hypothetical protein